MAALSEKKKKIKAAERQETKDSAAKLRDDDYMMVQIDRFRDQAAQLQQQLKDREEQLARLEELVEEKDQQVRELTALEQARRQENEQFLESADRQFRDMVYRLEGRINVLAREIEEKVASDEKLSEDQTVKLQWEIKQIDRHLDKLKSDLSDKTHQEMLTTYRNMHTGLEEMQAHIDEAIEQLGVQTKAAMRPDETVIRRVRRPAVAAMIFSALSLLCVIGYILIDSGLVGFTFF